MLVTEEEAMGRMCIHPDGGACLASACMAWRWQHDGRQWAEVYAVFGSGTVPLPEAPPDDGRGKWELQRVGDAYVRGDRRFERKATWFRNVDRIYGFCGLAGKPL